MCVHGLSSLQGILSDSFECPKDLGISFAIASLHAGSRFHQYAACLEMKTNKVLACIHALKGYS